MTGANTDLALLGLLLAVLLVLALLAVVVSAARRGAAADRKPGQAARQMAIQGLRTSFRKAVRLIEKNLASRAERYKLSWTLVLEEDSSLPLRAAGLRGALDADTASGVASQGIDWHFFDKGVLVSLRTELLGAGESRADSGLWDAFLGLCRGYRPQRPFDALVLVLPCAALLGDDADARLALAARAQALHRRLWLAQNRLALRFPLHLVVAGCETLPGFAAFGAALPESQRRAILGWASPYDLVAPFRAAWIDSALDEVVVTVAGACDELCALEPGHADSSAYLALPGELERLRTGLKLFCEELMRPSAYHEAFLLRGIYLSGDAGPAAQLQVAAGMADGEEAERMPVFLHDIFERKIFAETGLVRASRQRLRQSAGGRLGQVLALGLPLAWAIGLLVATWQLNAKQHRLVAYLQALAPPAPGSPADPARSLRAALTALEGFEPLGGESFHALTMPGSWPVFETLDDRLRARLEEAFARHAVAALTDAARARMSELSGVARDPFNGKLLENGQCTLPAGWRQEVASAPAAELNLKSLPEFGAMIGYISSLDRLDAALAAMQRLARPDGAPASGEDLTRAVGILLNRELDGKPDRTAALYRVVAQDTPGPSYPAFQQAARCAFERAAQEMYRHLFDGNSLLVNEQIVADRLLRLREGVHDGSGLAARLQLWRELDAALAEQQRQLVAGQGAWIRLGSFDKGSAQETVLRRTGANRLLGTASVQQARDMARQRFEGFSVAWEGARTAAAQAGGSALVWSGAAWSFAPQRKALHESASALLALPWMQVVTPAPLLAVPPGATLRWDRAQLDRAAGLAESRKAFLGGLYAGFPMALQPAAGALVDAALAGQAQAALAQALSLGPRQVPGADSDAERAAALRIRVWLGEIGAHELAGQLDAALAGDALTRLTHLDAIFDAVGVYQPREGAFQGWNGDKGALLDVFGGGDAAGLALYLEQQQEFIDTIVGQADGVLAALDGGEYAREPVVARWKSLAADLRRYRLKSPTSTRLALENFIVNASGDIDLANCVDRLGSRRAARRGADLFAQRLAALQEGMLARCHALADGNDQRQWQLFADAYNRDLGRRSPFVMTSGLDAVMEQASIPADRDTVGAVLKLYDRARAGGEARAEVRQADQHMQRLAELLAPLYPADQGVAGGLDVAVEFRANGGDEAGADQIIDWSLGVGTATVRRGEAPRVLRWEPGMPVQLVLRFARDGLLAPQPVPERVGMSVAGRTLTFRCDDPWALFTFVNGFRDAERSGEDARAPLLRFDFPLAPVAAPAVAAAGTPARVYLRLRVSPPGKHVALAWPVLFPARLPSWNEPLRSP